jgi:hypothetical protein
MLKFFAIVATCIAASIVYGVIHDQATVRICPEYFTVAHRDIGTKSPTLIALYWGVVATWWVGAGLGVLIAGFSRIGRAPRVELREVLLPIVYLMLFTLVIAILAGIAGGVAASNRWFVVSEGLRERIPAQRHIGFLIDLWAHAASYAAGALGGIFLAGWIAGRRSESRRLNPQG